MLVVEALRHQRGQLPAEDVLGVVAEHGARRVVPEGDAAVLLGRDDGVVDRLGDGLEAPRRAAQLLLHPAPVGDVLADGVEQLLLDCGLRAEQDPAPAAVLVLDAHLELARLVVAAGQRQRLGTGALAVVGVDEVEVGARPQLLERPPERAFPRRVGVLEVAVEAGRREQVPGESEQPGHDAVDARLGLSAHADALFPAVSPVPASPPG